MPATIANRHSSRLKQIRNRLRPQRQPTSMRDACQRIYTDAETIYFDTPLQAVVTFRDGSILTVNNGQPRALKFAEKQELIPIIRNHPRHLQHSPRHLTEATPYQNLTAICLQILNPNPTAPR